ncbi:MAG: hypothetical protein H0T40_03760 [Geodermatophilaceae bacterium]|nr:hypothetical protein [Geodermatophilaceae bacterium]
MLLYSSPVRVDRWLGENSSLAGRRGYEILRASDADFTPMGRPAVELEDKEALAALLDER